MRIDLSDNVGYESFQLFWIALGSARLQKTEDLARLARLRNKLRTIGNEVPGGGLVPKSPEMPLDLTGRERVFLATAISSCPWIPERVPEAKAALARLGLPVGDRNSRTLHRTVFIGDDDDKWKP